MRSLRIVAPPADEGEPDDTDLPVLPPSEGSPPKVIQSKGAAAQTEAIRYIFDFAGPRQGYRLTCIGGTGTGKTYLQRKIAVMASQRENYVLIHDGKDRVPQYQGAIRDSVFSLHRNPLPPGTNTVVFRHEEPDKVAEMAWKLSDQGITSLLLVDEVYDALDNDRHFKPRIVNGKKTHSRIEEIYRKGRSRGNSIVGSTQVPQTIPTVMMTQSDFSIVFKLDARSLNYAEAMFRLPKNMTDTIRKLGRGQFVLIQQGVDWNGIVYGPH